MSQIPDRAAALAALRRAVSDGRAGKRADGGPIPRRSGRGSAPLSFAQQRLWLLDQLAPGSFAYNVPRALRLRGALDVRALEEALDAIVQRHEVLRTPFAWEDGSVVQVVLEAHAVDLSRVDLRHRGHVGDPDRERTLRRRMVDELRRPFDLSRDRMLRATLYQLGEDEHALLVVTHHIASDGWSKGVLFRELCALYEAFALGDPRAAPPLPELPIQYADFALWQRETLEGPRLDEHLAYWRKQLAGAPPALDLPADRPRPMQQTHRGEKQYPVFAAELTQALVALARREGVTLFMVLMAAFKVLLHRTTGQDDVVVGTTVAGRTRPELEGLLGFFMNTLVLRTDLSGGPSFRELLRREREVALGAYEHQDLPFEKLVEALQPTRDLSREPLVQVIFLLDTPAAAPRLQGLDVTPIEVDTGAAKYDLILALVEEGGELRGKVEYSTDLFDAATVGRLLWHYRVVLEAVTRDAGVSIDAIPLLSAAERQTVLVAWNDTTAPFPRDATVHGLVSSTAARVPDAVALVCGEVAITYGELDQRSQQVANHLRRRGVAPGSRVGIAVERSVDLVVGLLGILKAGAAYVPLDPTYPRERLAFMIEDAAISALVTEARVAASLPVPGDQGTSALPLILLDADREAIAGESAEPAASSASASSEDLAYVIYTSGSTGKPKGVELPHRAVVNFLASMAQRPGIAERDVLCAVTSLSFDIAGLEIFLPLTTGAKVVIARREVASDGGRLAALLAQRRVTMLQATPSTFRLLLAAGWKGSAELTILCGGEAFPPDLAAALHERCGAVWNMYGPTETTIWSTIHPIASQQAPMRIGRPIANTRVYVVDARLEPVPIGIPGELLIGGDGVARGYWNRPELTAERFIPDPFVPGANGRLYRTGDLVRWRADGELEFLGRLDHQVKIRGHRVELGEIEAALARLPSVKESVVIAREDAVLGQRLVAYVVPAQELPSLDASELRRELAATLPEIMIPSAFVCLAALPLTPNGKIDRGALPPPEVGAAFAVRGFVAPRTPTEAAIAAIFADVLGLAGARRVGAHDHFFELGGHSLLAMGVIARLHDALGARLPMRAVFEAPSVEALARAVDEVVPRDGAGVSHDAMSALLAELEGMSEEEAERRLADELAGAEG